MNIRTYYKKYPVNNTDNIFGDFFGLLEIQFSDSEDPTSVTTYTMFLSDKGLPPKILSYHEALQAKANTFYEN